MSVRIDALDAGIASRNHVVPAMDSGNTVKLTVGQILDLLVGSAPGQLDTLEELAAALADDENYAATVTAALALKAPLASPALTGTPTAPTASPGTDTTQLATTGFVDAAVSALPTPVFTQEFESSELAISSAAAITVAHGLGGLPKMMQALLRCKTADLGYAVGDEVLIGTEYYTSSSATERGLSLGSDATNVFIKMASLASPITIINLSTGAVGSVTNASWRVIVRAWR